jgi:hypothetical protein
VGVKFYPTNLDDHGWGWSHTLYDFSSKEVSVVGFYQEEDCLQVRRPVTFMTGLDSGKREKKKTEDKRES